LWDSHDDQMDPEELELKLKATTAFLERIRRRQREAEPKPVLRWWSTFSGISALSAAIDPEKHQIVAFSEIDPFACTVLAERCGASRPVYMPRPEDVKVPLKPAPIDSLIELARRYMGPRAVDYRAATDSACAEYILSTEPPNGRRETDAGSNADEANGQSASESDGGGAAQPRDPFAEWRHRDDYKAWAKAYRAWSEADTERRRRVAAIKAVRHLPEWGNPKARVINWGDIAQVTEADVREMGRRFGTIHCLEGGSPCQAFSIAGDRNGLQDERGKLTLVYAQLLRRMERHCRTRWCLWENVPGVLNDAGNAFGHFISALCWPGNAVETRPADWAPLSIGRDETWPDAGLVTGRYRTRSLAWRVVDAQFFGVPQRRRRVYALYGSGASRPEEVLFDSRSGSGRPSEGSEPPKGTTGAPGSSASKNRATRLTKSRRKKLIRFGFAARGQVVTIERGVVDDAEPASMPATGKPRRRWIYCSKVAPTVTTGAPYARTGNARSELDALVVQGTFSAAFSAGQSSKARTLGWQIETASTLRASASGSNQVPTLLTTVGATVDENVIVRRMMPVECERLQGFPDGWTEITFMGKPAEDAHRYRALGNSMAVPCVRFFVDRIWQAYAALFEEVKSAA
jgi:DNA (cytosine-5)-methyltransferase 1